MPRGAVSVQEERVLGQVVVVVVHVLDICRHLVALVEADAVRMVPFWVFLLVHHPIEGLGGGGNQEIRGEISTRR
jgi:hypothetical protein